jgi:hypothetical protein
VTVVDFSEVGPGTLVEAVQYARATRRRIDGATGDPEVAAVMAGAALALARSRPWWGRMTPSMQRAFEFALRGGEAP